MGNKGWKLLSKKVSPHLVSHQYVMSNAEDPLCGSRSPCMQMLVRTVFEGVSFEDVEDFFIDDSFRNRWDRCFVSSEKLIECHEKEEDERPSSQIKGGEVVRWVRKFPAFCGQREYIIARRTFREKRDTQCGTCVENQRVAYVVSKSTDCDLPPKIKRVKEYYSSWRIREVASAQRTGERAVEVMLLHYEDLGFPNSIFKLAMRTFFGWFITGLETNGLREYVKTKGEKKNNKGRGGVEMGSDMSSRKGKGWKTLRNVVLAASSILLANKKYASARR